MRKGDGDARTRFFTRTVTTTIIKVARFADGQVTGFPDIIVPVRVISNTAITREINKAYPDEKGLFCVNTEYREELRRLSVEDFLKYSTVVTVDEAEKAE